MFRLDGNNHAARLDYANLLVERGELEEAIGQFLRLVEQDWSNAAGHRRLAELALTIGDLDHRRDPCRPRLRARPDDPRGPGASSAAVDYRDGEPRRAAAMAPRSGRGGPGQSVARMVLIAERIGAGDQAAALADRCGSAMRRRTRGCTWPSSPCSSRPATAPRSGSSSSGWPRLFPDERRRRRGADPVASRRPAISMPPSRCCAPGPQPGPGSPERIAADAHAGAGPARDPRRRGGARPSSSSSSPAAADPAPYRRVLAGLDVEPRPHRGAASPRSSASIAGAEPSDDRRDTADRAGPASSRRTGRRGRRAASSSTRCSPRTPAMWRR